MTSNSLTIQAPYCGQIAVCSIQVRSGWLDASQSMVNIGIGYTPSVRLMAKSPKNRRSRTKGQDKHRPSRRWPWLLGAGGLLTILLVVAYGANHSAQPANPPQLAT